MTNDTCFLCVSSVAPLSALIQRFPRCFFIDLWHCLRLYTFIHHRLLLVPAFILLHFRLGFFLFDCFRLLLIRHWDASISAVSLGFKTSAQDLRRLAEIPGPYPPASPIRIPKGFPPPQKKKNPRRVSIFWLVLLRHLIRISFPLSQQTPNPPGSQCLPWKELEKNPETILKNIHQATNGSRSIRPFNPTSARYINQHRIHQVLKASFLKNPSKNPPPPKESWKDRSVEMTNRLVRLRHSSGMFPSDFLLLEFVIIFRVVCLSLSLSLSCRCDWSCQSCRFTVATRQDKDVALLLLLLLLLFVFFFFFILPLRRCEILSTGFDLSSPRRTNPTSPLNRCYSVQGIPRGIPSRIPPTSSSHLVTIFQCFISWGWKSTRFYLETGSTDSCKESCRMDPAESRRSRPPICVALGVR